jgi:hypothetical protein
MYFTVPRSAYLLKAADVGILSNYCILGITGYVPDNVNKMVFGSVFLQNYYSIYDYETGRIGLALDVISEGNISDTASIHGAVILMITLASIIGAIIGLCLVVCIIRRRNSRDMKIKPIQ